MNVRRLSVALLLLAGCSCGERKGGSAEELVPADAPFAASAPNPGVLADHAQALLGTLRKGAGGAEAVTFAANLARQLGFDPLTRDGLTQAGLDPARPLALGAYGNGGRGMLAVLPSKDDATLEATIVRIVGARTGANVREERTHGEPAQKVQVLARAAGGTPAAAFARRAGFVLLAVGDAPVEAVAAALTRTPEQSLAKAAPFVAAKAKLGARDLVVFLPKAPPRTLPIPGALALGVGLSGDELALRFFAALDPEQQKAIASTFIGGGEALVTRLPGDAPVYLRGAVDWKEALKRLEGDAATKGIVSELRTEASAVGVDIDQELFANIEPAFGVAFGIANSVNLSHAFDMNPRRQNPFENYTLVGVGTVKDPAKALTTLEKLPGIVEKLGATVKTREAGGTKVWTAEYRLGEGLSWTLQGNKLVVAGGFSEALDKTLEELAAGKTTLKPDSLHARLKEALVAKTGLALVVDFERIGKAVDALPTSAFGTGPGAFMARSVASGVVQPLSRLKALAAVQPTDGGVIVDVAAIAK